jgi:hypothetical protein
VTAARRTGVIDHLCWRNDPDWATLWDRISDTTSRFSEEKINALKDEGSR